MRDDNYRNEEIDNANNEMQWDYKQTLITGFKSGIETTWTLAKIIVPVYLFITILEYTYILEFISKVFEPIMRFVGLPGEASIILVLGNAINIFAALGAIAGITLTSKQITIIAVMLSFSHSLFTETAVAKKTGISVFIVLTIRIALATISGIILNVLI